MNPKTQSDAMPTVLRTIVEERRRHIPYIASLTEGVEKIEPSRRSLYDALLGTHNIIMECKSASPSLGSIRPDYHPWELARIYSRYAAAISVLCEPVRFSGDYNHLATVSASTHLPVLCKDFVIDSSQIRAARYFGADAVLLMLSVLSDSEYSSLAACAHDLGLDVLTEVISEEEMARATHLGARIIGINHRNLHDLTIDLTRSRRLRPFAPEGAVVIAESGITDNATLRALSGTVNGFLVGSSLTGQEDVDSAARALLYGYNKVCGLRTPSEAQVARACGAYYGGLIFAPESPRNVSRETSRSIMDAEPSLKYVAVTTSTNLAEISSLLDDLPNLYALQLHYPTKGSVSEECAALDQIHHLLHNRAHPPRVWRALSMDQASTALDAASTFVEQGSVDKIVLDSGTGGTGRTFDWEMIPERLRPHVLLAGGIGPDSAARAAALGVHGLDINSATEGTYTFVAGARPASSEPERVGREKATHQQRTKDAARVRATFDAIRYALPL